MFFNRIRKTISGCSRWWRAQGRTNLSNEDLFGKTILKEQFFKLSVRKKQYKKIKGIKIKYSLSLQNWSANKQK